MNKKGITLGSVVVIVAIGLIVLSISGDNNSDVGRTHGTVSTSMGSSVVGNSDAPITIVEFGDYQCHQCYNWFHNTKSDIFENYVETGKANFVFVDLAFLGKDSPIAAQATYCAEDQGQYWEYHDLLYNSQEPTIDGGWANPERLKAFAFNLGLDMELFEACLDSGKYSERVKFNTSEAKNQGARGTPTFIIVDNVNDRQQKLVGAQPYGVFQQVMDEML